MRRNCPETISLAKGIDQRRQEALGAEFKLVERGWCLGNEEFRQELWAAPAERIGATHYGLNVGNLSL